MATLEIDADPRKLPRQARSKATVEAILTGAAQVLVELGYDGATTARVAERAGVSIGSLYQYFPNKEALVAALVERHTDELVAVIESALGDSANITLADGMKAMIRAGVRGHRLSPVLHKIFSEQVPRVGRLGIAMDTHARITALIERYLRQHLDEMAARRDPAVAALVVESIVEALVHRAVLGGSGLLTEETVEREAVNAVLGYLCEFL